MKRSAPPHPLTLAGTQSAVHVLTVGAGQLVPVFPMEAALVAVEEAVSSGPQMLSPHLSTSGQVGHATSRVMCCPAVTAFVPLSSVTRAGPTVPPLTIDSDCTTGLAL